MDGSFNLQSSLERFISRCPKLLSFPQFDYVVKKFSKDDGKAVKEFKLRVIYIPANPPSPVPEGSEEFSLPRASVLENGHQNISLFDSVSRFLEDPKEKSSEVIFKIVRESQHEAFQLFITASIPVLKLLLISGLGAYANQYPHHIYYSFHSWIDSYPSYKSSSTPEEILDCCAAAAVGAGLLKSEEILEGVVRLLISNDIEFEEENFVAMMNEAKEAI